MKNAQHLMNDLGFINDRLYSLNKRLRELTQPFCGIPNPQPRKAVADSNATGPSNYLMELGYRLELATEEIDEANELLNWLGEAMGQGGENPAASYSGAKAAR